MEEWNVGKVFFLFGVLRQAQDDIFGDLKDLLPINNSILPSFQSSNLPFIHLRK